MQNLFQGGMSHPEHLSVGAIVLRDGKIACHHFANVNDGDIYMLMRETLQPQDTLEAAVNRGLQKEFGLIATVKDYLGSIQSYFPNFEGIVVRKTTLYFLCDYTGETGERKVLEDFDGVKSIIEWHDPEFLITHMKEQTARFTDRTDLDESQVLGRLNP